MITTIFCVACGLLAATVVGVDPASDCVAFSVVVKVFDFCEPTLFEFEFDSELELEPVFELVSEFDEGLSTLICDPLNVPRSGAFNGI